MNKEYKDYLKSKEWAELKIDFRVKKQLMNNNIMKKNKLKSETRISDLETTYIPLSQSIKVNQEIWQPTCLLKWVDKRMNGKVLYQKWYSSEGHSKWIEVPTE